MKKFLPQLGGHNVRNDDMMVVQQAFTEAIAGIVNTFDNTGNGNCILSGLVTSSVVVGSNVHITYSAGYVAISGEVCVFQSQTLILPAFGTPAQWIYIQQTPITPSSPVPYADTTNKNVHFDREAIVSGTPTGGEIYFPTTGWNAIYVTDLAHSNVIQKGLVMEFFPDPTYPGGHEENALFDSTGKGVGRMKGFQVMNGLNNSQDLRGQFTFMPSVGMFNSAALLSNVVTGVSISQRYGQMTNTILTNNLPTAPITISPSSHSHTINLGTHNHGIVAQSKISRDIDMDAEIDSHNHWSYYKPNNSNWVNMWHNHNLDGSGQFAWATGDGYTHGVNWINPLMEPSSPPDSNNDEAVGYFENMMSYPSMPHVSWVIDVNTPFDDWYSNGLHSQQPSGYQIGNVGSSSVAYDTTHPAASSPWMDGGYPGDVGYSWSPSTNKSYPDSGQSGTLSGATINGVAAVGAGTVAGELTTNGYNMLFNDKITDTALSGTTNSVTISGIINNGGVQAPFVTVSPGFAMIKIWRNA